MSITNLIRRGGLSTYATATSMTVATRNSVDIKSVAEVATVAVAVLPIEQNQSLIKFVQLCCDGASVTVDQVINSLLSEDDENDIVNGYVSKESLRLHINLWINAGKPYYSGKGFEK
ncbi:hypothetical protein [Legionella septentrionalis]|uniref:hypothetical protein n=1 Tax=Legionella septentrionalis TaxID=2498109 RepID=UPI0011D0FC80|nr:hypothetical protein [Legionella septentrionalis]